MSEDYFYPEENELEERPFRPSSPPPQPNGRGKDFTYLPPRAIALAMTEYTELHENKSVLTWGVPKMDERIAPFQKTTYTAIIGRPGMGKSYEMMRLARHHANQLRAATVAPKKAPLVIYATWETSVEEFVGVYGSSYTGIALSDIGRGKADMKKLKDGLVTLMRDNFCVFGTSHVDSRKYVDTIPTPPTLMDLYQGVAYLRNQGHEIGALYIDYAQAIPNERGVLDMERVTSRVSKNILDAKALFCVSSGIPTFVGVQGRREIDDYGGLKLPKIIDGQHTSVIEQAFDRVFGVTMPSKYMVLGNEIGIVDEFGHSWAYEVTPNTRVITMLKQRYHACDKSDTWATEFDPVKLSVALQTTKGEIIAETSNDMREVM